MSNIVDLLIEHDREYRAAAETHRLRQTAKVIAAQRQARVAQAMKDFELTRRDAEAFIEIEAIMDGSDWMRRQVEGKQQ